MNAKITVGVSGGIAAYKAVEVVSALGKLGADVTVIMTPNAARFVAPATFEAISRNPVRVDTFEQEEKGEIGHIALGQKTDLVIVVPATANTMAKMAVGIADNMLTSTLIAATAPILVAPSMNTHMWQAEATQQNLRTLQARGVRFVGPASGNLACGTVGAGRMSEPQEIVAEAVRMLEQKHDLEGLNVLVTAGPTRERLDPVRYMSNDSSGKMGYAIAEAALARGAKVTLVTGPTQLTVSAGAETVPVESTMDLLHAMEARCDAQDVIIQAAAPADYRFAEPSDRKLKKENGAPLMLTLVENPDVAKTIAAHKREGQTLVGFAAETHDTLENARKKLVTKGLDMIVANDVTREGAGFGTDTNIATLITAQGETECPLMTKRELAERILDAVIALRKNAENG
ncbi:MAG: bifunctional phosphopantothenoylcysteine decarboxylase/phosphopantothenate--cysteine ligase CoaBC [Eubacteriales bacterium]|nr:bifunctional phosphopantothenoylcysteine decarboxylase/phosphopantothenate--cysteine ligase CoaBC [Eubacteriales bacterium]